RLVHDSCFTACILLNGILISLILFKTPAYLRSFSIVLFYLSIVEVSTAICSLLIFRKVMGTSTHIIDSIR
ncbi:hypothetical protein PMAYCL1PPCAC_15605, partial [Pristionchus mayeri]